MYLPLFLKLILFTHGGGDLVWVRGVPVSALQSSPAVNLYVGIGILFLQSLEIIVRYQPCMQYWNWQILWSMYVIGLCGAVKVEDSRINSLIIIEPNLYFYNFTKQRNPKIGSLPFPSNNWKCEMSAIVRIPTFWLLNKGFFKCSDRPGQTLTLYVSFPSPLERTGKNVYIY